MTSFERNKVDVPSCLLIKYFTLTNKPRQISPFLLNLNLNPLYSIRGGSTTLTDPFTKNPTDELFLKNPLYK